MTSRPTSTPLELWGGAECTVNRVGNAYFDQVELTGFGRRLDDLDRFADLGIRAFRFPVLWERSDQAWEDAGLARLRDLGFRPIVGLVHHGSGPRETSLLDPHFPEKVAAYARTVAERYPWVEDWTPVNEPLTTARFSCLYGHWYPHRRDDVAFARALVIQCRAVVLAMRAIREVIPAARLVQTEDLGKTHARPQLLYQADLENERRWITFDLLTGRLGEDDPMWGWLVQQGWIAPRVLRWFGEDPCPPDVVGVNHYLSSERFLDERLDLYPEDSHGGNGRDRYADVLAARVRGAGPDGPAVLLREAWERYRLPVAVTEAHNGCTREEQLRWLREVWEGALDVQREGADVRAVTLWSLLGAVGWDRLVTEPDRGSYEPGVFDVRSGSPRPTAIARLARSLALEGRSDEPLARLPGWWRRPERLWYGPEGACTDGAWDESGVPPLLVTGKTGTLGSAFARLCELRGIPYRLLSRSELDIAEPEQVARVLEAHRPWAVVNTAGYVRVDEAETEPERCARENADGPAVLAAGCAAAGARFLTFSSDLVFGGEKLTPYVEADRVAPLSVYGRTKAEAERRVLEACPNALVVRTSAFFGPWDEHNFVTLALRRLRARLPFEAAEDAVVSPTYVPDLVNASLDLLIDAEHGVWHLANEGAVTWAELAEAAAEAAKVPSGSLRAVSADDLELAAERPRYSALGSERGGSLAPLTDALARYLAESKAA